MKTQKKRDHGFTLIELLIVMSVMIVLMALIIPSALNMVKNANQTSAIQTVKAIGSAETQYSASYPQNGFSCSLASLGGAPGTAPSATAAQVLDPQLASTGVKSGYTFTIDKCTKTTVNNQDNFSGYTIYAVPNSLHRTGDRGYCMDESGVLKYDPAGGTNCTMNQ